MRVFGTIHYVSPTGNNGNPGTIGSPWQTLSFATGAVSTAGDVIFMTAGTFIESTPCNLKPQVSLDGAGRNSTHVKVHYVYAGSVYDAFLLLTSNTEGSIGNQTISNIDFDGDSLTGTTCIMVRARNDVIIHDVTFRDFLRYAVFWNGRVGTYGTAPGTYMSGCQMYNDSMINCSDRQVGSGNITYTGVTGLLIHDTWSENIKRPQGHNGNLFTGVAGHIIALKFYNNFCHKPDNEGTTPNYCIESWLEKGGIEVYNNIFHAGGNCIDAGTGGSTKGEYAYAWYVHDNLFYMDNPLPTSPFQYAMGVQWEDRNSDVIITHNIFRNLQIGVRLSLTHEAGDFNQNFTIDHNLFDNVGLADGGFGANCIIIDVNFTDNYSRDINVYNNTIIGYNALSGLYEFGQKGAIRNVKAINNIFTNATGSGYITLSGALSNINDSTNSNHNLLFGNGNANAIKQAGTIVVTHLTSSPNIIAAPNLNSSFYPNTGSPAIDAGIDIGYPFSGAAPDIGWYETASGGGNISPTVNAGPDITITLPTTSVFLSGTASDPDGTIASYSWTLISGGSNTIVDPTNISTGVTGLSPGVYVFQLEVTDNLGATATDQVTVTVNPVAPIPTQNYIRTNHRVRNG